MECFLGLSLNAQNVQEEGFASKTKWEYIDVQDIWMMMSSSFVIKNSNLMKSKEQNGKKFQRLTKIKKEKTIEQFYYFRFFQNNYFKINSRSCGFLPQLEILI